MSSEELARLLRTNPKLSMMFVEKYIDLDGKLLGPVHTYVVYEENMHACMQAL